VKLQHSCQFKDTSLVFTGLHFNPSVSTTLRSDAAVLYSIYTSLSSLNVSDDGATLRT
jgi:hypothetical protein